MLKNKIEEISKVILVGAELDSPSAGYTTTDETLDELAELVKTAGGEAVAIVTQKRRSPDPATFIGEGKLAEVREAAENLEADLLVFDNELSPSQLKNIERETGIRAIDRSMLILDIFALHAQTKEGKLQVEMAQLRYTLPRLTGKGIELSRLGGTSSSGSVGTRGPGETQLELDRRKARMRLATLQKELDEVKKNRSEQRKSRGGGRIPQVAIIGYTNAGKSTLLNALTGAGVLAENKLFATLDPTTRILTLGGKFDILLTDTVGFIRNLPHHLIEAFSSTLLEVTEADLLLEVVDATSPAFPDQMEVTRELIEKLGATDTPIVTAFNKCDLAPAADILGFPDSAAISAKDGTGLDELMKLVFDKLSAGRRELLVLIPYDKGFLLDQIHGDGSVLDIQHTGEGTLVRLLADEKLAGRLAEYRRRG